MSRVQFEASGPAVAAGVLALLGIGIGIGAGLKSSPPPNATAAPLSTTAPPSTPPPASAPQPSAAAPVNTTIPSASTPAAPPGWRLVFSDEFDGNQLDTSKWIDSYPGGERTHSNHEQQYYATDSYKVSGGTLKLVGTKKVSGAGMPYTSGMICSYGKFAQRYGRFDIRAKFPKSKGIWPAFWLLPSDRTWPPEIDILEILGHEPKRIHFTNHWGTSSHHENESQQWDGPDFSTDFHVISLEWTADALIWSVDGTERARTSRNIPQQPMFVIANLAIGGDWPGFPDASTAFPSTMEVDYIRVYAR